MDCVNEASCGILSMLSFHLWKNKRQKQQGIMLYIVYGSCMQQEHKLCTRYQFQNLGTCGRRRSREGGMEIGWEKGQ